MICMNKSCALVSRKFHSVDIYPYKRITLKSSPTFCLPEKSTLRDALQKMLIAFGNDKA